MKSRIIIAAIVLSAIGPAQAMSLSEADSLISKASTRYASGDHAAALLLFDSVNAAYSSPALLYNIGNCHFKLNDIPRAILFYERSLRSAPGDEDVKANLDLARQKVVDRVNELPAFNLGTTWGKLRGGKDADQWARRSLWACLALFLALALGSAIRHRGLRRVLFGAGGLLALVTVISIAFAAFRHQEVTNEHEAIVMSPKVDVRSEPRENTTVLFVLHKGTKVNILQTENGWAEVRLANGSVGWMPPATTETI